MSWTKKTVRAIARSLDTTTRKLLLQGIAAWNIGHLRGKELLSALIKKRHLFRYTYQKETGRKFQGDLLGHFKDLTGV